MDDTTMTNGMVAVTGALTRTRFELPLSANMGRLADVLTPDQGTTASTPILYSWTGSDAAVLVGSMGQAPIQGDFGPITGYAPTTTTFIDVAPVRTGSPPV